jgi:hypothetical protein
MASWSPDFVGAEAQRESGGDEKRRGGKDRVGSVSRVCLFTLLSPN